VADGAGYLTVMCNTNHDEDTELRYLQLLQDHRVAGVVFIAGGFEGRGYREGVKRRVETIRAYGGHVVALGPRADRLPAEVPDNRGGARLGTTHLLELGHTRIAFIACTVGLRTAKERLAGFREALAAVGLPLDERLVVHGGFSEAGGAAAMRELLSSGLDFTAVFASNDAMALGCLQELARSGLRVPDDVSLLGMDGIPIGRALNPPLTTVAVPMRDIGAAGMHRLLSLMETGGTELNGRRRTNVHATELLVRRSTGPPPATGRRGRPPGPASPSTAKDNAPLSRGSDSNEEGES
jgi:LacI family transcriptional regulator